MKNTNKYKLIFFISALFVGAISTGTQYVSAYLKLLGLNAAQVGFFTSLRSLIGIISPIIWGLMCDKYQTIKKPFIVCLIITIILFPLIPLSEKNIIFASISFTPWITVIVRFAYRPLEEIFYSWSIQKDNSNTFYSNIKIISAIGGSLCSVIISFLLNYLTLRVSFYTVGINGLILLFFVLLADDVKPTESVKSYSLKNLHLPELFKNPLIFAYIIFGTTSLIPLCSAGNYISFLYEYLGIPSNAIGNYVTIKTVCRFPLLLLSPYVFKKFTSKQVMIFSALLILCGDFAYALSTNLIQIYIIATIANLAAGLLFISKAKYAYEISPPKLKSTMQMIASTQSALATMISSVLAGYIINSFNAKLFYLSSGIITLIVFIGYCLFIKIFNKHKVYQK